MLPRKQFISVSSAVCVIGCGLAEASDLAIQQMVAPGMKWYEELYDSPGHEPEPGTSEMDLLSDLTLKVSTTTLHDSNVGQTPDTAAMPAQGDFMTTLASSVQWARETSKWKLALQGSLGYDQYADLHQFNGLDYSSGALIGYRAGRLELGMRFRQSYDHAVNRFYGAMTDEHFHATALSAVYIVSPKTALVSVWQSSWTEPGSGFGSTERQAANLSALWRYSELLQIGPGIGFTSTTGQRQVERTSLGPTLSAIYKLSEKVDLNSQVGMDYVDYDGGGTDEFLSARIGLKYVMSPLWAFDFSLIRDAEADGSLAGGFRETTAVRLGVVRNIRRATIRVGLGFENSTFSSASGPTPRPPIDYLTGDVSLTFPIIADHLSASLFFRYMDSSSDEVIRDWKTYQVGASLIYQF